MNAPNEFPKDRGLLKLTTTSLSFLLVAMTVNAQQINRTQGFTQRHHDDRPVFEKCFVNRVTQSIVAPTAKVQPPDR
jgi:hypothetical protein